MAISKTIITEIGSVWNHVEERDFPAHCGATVKDLA